MKVSNANTEQVDGKDLKILDIIHSLENPRLRLGFSKLFKISRILRSSPPMGSVLYHYDKYQLLYPYMNYIHDINVSIKYPIIIHGYAICTSFDINNIGPNVKNIDINAI